MYKETGETGIDTKGEYYIIRWQYNQPCNCHPETCVCGGVVRMDYKEKKYLKDKHACINCKSCELYENHSTSNRYFCKITDEFISDIKQDFCHKFKIE